LPGGGFHGRGSGRGGDRGGYRGGRGDSFASDLPPLPDKAPFPDGIAAKIPYKDFIPRGKVGRKAVFFANHHSILTLPTIKIYQCVAQPFWFQNLIVIRYDLRFRVPESSQARGSDKVTASQMARLLVHSGLKSLLGEHFVFDGVSVSQISPP
jgi:hypothetical protein